MEGEVDNLSFGLTHFIFDGNELKPSMPNRLAGVLKGARKLKELSLRKCQLEDNGLKVTFEKLSPLMYIKRMDFSENAITDYGIESVSHCIGLNKKSSLKSICFSHNAITTVGLIKLF